MRQARRYVIPALLALGLFTVWAIGHHPARALRQPLAAAVPMTLVGYSGTDIEVRAEELRSAHTTSYIARRYSRAGAATPSFEVHVCYYAHSGRQKWKLAHRLCHMDPMWAIVDMRTDSIAHGEGRHTVRRFVVQRDTMRATALYWQQGRGHAEARPLALKWNQIRDGMLFRRSDEALIRVMVPLTNGEAAANEVAEAVAAELAELLPAALPAPVATHGGDSR
jgi:EpsI family protein